MRRFAVADGVEYWDKDGDGGAAFLPWISAVGNTIKKGATREGPDKMGRPAQPSVLARVSIVYWLILLKATLALALARRIQPGPSQLPSLRRRRRTNPPLLRLGLLLALVSRLQRGHAGLADLGVPGVEVAYRVGLDDR